jgi:hypothetical protein
VHTPERGTHASPAVVATAPAKARQGKRGKNPSPEELELQGLATAGTASTRIKSRQLGR